MENITEVELEYEPISKIYKLFSWIGCYMYPRTIMRKGKNYVVLIKEDDEEYKDKINRFITKVAMKCIVLLMFFSFFIISIIVYI